MKPLIKERHNYYLCRAGYYSAFTLRVPIFILFLASAVLFIRGWIIILFNFPPDLKEIILFFLLLILSIIFLWLISLLSKVARACEERAQKIFNKITLP